MMCRFTANPNAEAACRRRFNDPKMMEDNREPEQNKNQGQLGSNRIRWEETSKEEPRMKCLNTWRSNAEQRPGVVDR